MEKRNPSTKILWEKGVDDLNHKYKNYLESYPYLMEEKYCHKKEQLYLMLQYGMSETFIDSFFKGDETVTSRDLDLMRLIAMLFGETFVQETFYKKEFPFSHIKEILFEKAVQMKCAELPKLEELLTEYKWMKERFELQCEFFEKEQERAKQQFQEMLAKEKEVGEARASKERLKIELDNGILEGKLQKAEEEKKKLLDQCAELKSQLSGDSKREEERTGGCFFQMRRKKEQQRIRREKEERNQFILDVISDYQYSKEQLEIIIQAVKAEVSLAELQKLCNPDLPIKNMELLMEYYLK